MGRVKGSKQHSMVLKHHEPYKRWLVVAGILVAVVLVAVAAFWGGQQYEREAQKFKPGGEIELKQLHEQIAELEQGHVIDRTALENARLTLQEKEELIQQLDKSLTFYKGIMAPENNARGLQVDRLGVEKGDSDGYFRIKWVLTQVGKNTAFLSGDVNLEIIGTQAGKEKVLPLGDVMVGDSNLKFKFRYFQSFAVDVELPDQFQAAQVRIEASTSGNKPQGVVEQYDWLVQEIVSDVE